MKEIKTGIYMFPNSFLFLVEMTDEENAEIEGPEELFEIINEFGAHCVITNSEYLGPL